MTQYTFKPTSSTQYAKWSDPSFWTGGVVPNSADADVDFPYVYSVDRGSPYISYVSIEQGESFAVRTVQLRDYLTIKGSLSISGQLTQYQDGRITMDGGTLTAGSILNDAAQNQGGGRIVTPLYTNDTILSGAGLTVDAQTFINKGTVIAAGGTLAINAGSGGFSGLSGGTISSGGLQANNGGVLAIHASGPIVTDASMISLYAGGTITSFDPTTGRDVALTTSLRTIAPQGQLILQGASYHFDDLTVAGSLQVQYRTDLAVDRFVIANGGHLDGVATVSSAIGNDGIIRAGYDQIGFGFGNGGTLVLNGPITGAGSLEILPGHIRTGRFDTESAVTLELGGPTAQNVKFDNAAGALWLDQPSTFTGAITTSGPVTNEQGVTANEIILAGVGLGSITTTSYAGGTLTLQQGSSALTLKFLGNHDLSNFALAAGPQALSSDPPSLNITIVGARGAILAQDFNGNGEADLMWLNVNGAFQTWSNRTPVGAITDQFATNAFEASVATSWRITDSFDFNGDGYADVLWRNTNGALAVWTGSASSALRIGAFDGTVTPSWKIVGAGDLNGDGKGDILWQNFDGAITTWSSTGTSFAQGTYSHASVGVDWKVAGVGDFNGDGKADIFWRNAGDGAVSVWNSTGGSFQESSFFQGPLTLAWHAQGIGDFNGDGFDDILWRSDQGAVTVWLGNASGFTQNTYNTDIPAGWNVATVGDFNGDKRADVMWRNAEGYTSIWNSGGSPWQKGATFDTGIGNDWMLGGHIFPL